jgi:serine protease Do
MSCQIIETNKKELNMSWKRVAYLIVLVLVAGVSGLTGAVAGGLGVYQAVRQGKVAGLAIPAATGPAAPISSSDGKTLTFDTANIETTITQSVQKVGPAVVTVVSTIPGQATFFGMTGDQTVSGSGVFISAQGYILTNNHVVEGTKELTIVLSDGSQEKATLVGTDPYSDIAVLKASGKVPAVATLGNSDTLKPGETVIAIGSPLGDFKNTVTVGVVSATGRAIDTGRGYQIQGLIQTDAAINQGNSGGPLMDLAGEVIAINTLIVRNSGSGTVAEGLGFAIPVNTARAVASQIIQQGYFTRPDLGIAWQQVTPDIAARYNLAVEWGAYVTDVAANGPAGRAGLQVNDIITGIGDTPLDANHAYLDTLFLHKPGERVSVQFNRNGRAMQTEVVLATAEPGN